MFQSLQQKISPVEGTVLGKLLKVLVAITLLKKRRGNLGKVKKLELATVVVLGVTLKPVFVVVD